MTLIVKPFFMNSLFDSSISCSEPNRCTKRLSAWMKMSFRIRVKKDNTKNPRLVYPNNDIRSIILVSLPAKRSKIGRMGKMLNKKIRTYPKRAFEGNKPKLGMTLHAT